MRHAPRPLSLLALLLVPCIAQAAPDRYAIELRLFPADGRIEGEARVVLGSDHGATFRLAPGLVPEEATLAGRPVGLSEASAQWSWGEPAAAGDVVTLRYGGQLPKALGEELIFLAPEQGVLSAGSGWIPDLGREDATYELTLEVPEPYRAVATGRLLDEAAADGVYRVHYAHDAAGEPPSAFVGAFSVAERRIGPVTLRTFFDAEHAPLSPIYLSQAQGYIDHFSRRIGPYPYPSFSIVGGTLPVGLAFPGLTYVSSRILPLPFMQTTSLAHEILHSWWGNAVRVSYAEGNWAEGLTTYMADYGLAEAENRGRAREMRLAWLRDFTALPPERDQPLADFVGREHDAGQVVGYGKAAFVFHTLRRLIGDKGFDAAMRRLYAEHLQRPAGWSDIERLFEAEAGRELDAFFDQWLQRTGAPRLHLEDVAWEEAEDGYAVTVRIRQEEPAYILSVPVKVETDHGFVSRDVSLTGTAAEATLLVGGRPRAVQIDPDYNLFRWLAPGEAPPILRDVTLAASVNLVLPPDPAERKAAEALAGRLLDRQVEIASQPDEGKATLVVGTNAGLAPVLAAQGLAPPPELAGRGTARVWTVREPSGAVTLVVEANDAEALAALARPLPHYRRDSFLVFQEGAVAERGVWPSGENELSVRLD